ncbi:MAG: preprotein translocase subunit SecY [Candidatus Bathyarchaeia archaeon]
MPRFIEIFKPFIKYLPDIKKPERITFNEKLVWTAIALILYLIMSEVPLYGVGKGGAQDPLGALRVIFASSRGTLMELGIGPIVTGGLILQILSGSKMIDVDMTNPEDRSLFTGASKILAVLMTIFEALAYILGGAYGPLKVQTQIAILSQLVASGLILILLDEMLQKGWGLGSGISLFIAAGVAQRIWWDMVAPMGPMQDGKFLGALIAFTQSLQLGEGLKALYRGGGLPDMVGLLTTVAVVIIVIYVNGLKVSVPVSYAKYRGFRGAFPIKFLYTSNIPVIFAAALMGNIYFITQILWQRYNQTNTNFWLNLLGTYKVTEGHIEPTGGLIYYLAPPRSLTGLLGDPFRAAVYAGLFILMCIFFSVTWVEVGGMDPKTVAKQLIDSGMQIEGFRRSSLPIQQLLSRYIPTVTVLGGATVGAIAASADFLGAFGSGTGILLTVGILEQYYQILVKERMSEMFPALRGFLGE